MWKRLLAIGIVLVSCTNTAFAQRDEAPRTPRAITDEQLQHYCDLLELSDDQRHAAEIEFERYLDDFEPLRREMTEAALRNPHYSKSDLVLVRQLPAFIARTRAADEALFARIDAIIIESQSRNMQRVRMQRERLLLCNLQTIVHIIGDGVPDLRALLEALDPPPEIIDPLAASLDDYEVRLTSGVRSMFDDVMRLCASPGAQQRQEHGPNQQPDAAFIADIERVVASVRDLRTMNRRYFETTAPSLPDDLRRRWRDEFVLYAYGSASDTTRMWVLMTIDAALKSQLTDDQRQAVLAMRDEAWRAQEEILNKMMDTLDREAVGIAGPTGAAGSQEMLDMLNGSRQQVMERNMKIRQSLKDLLGAETIKRLQEQQTSESIFRHPQGGWRSAYGLVSYNSRVAIRKPGRGRPAYKAEPLMPWPIERDELELWIAAFAIEGDALAAVDALFADYTQKLDATVKPLQDLAFRNSSNVSIGGPAKDPFERARAAEDARAKMRAAIDVADAEFLLQLREAIGYDIDQTMWDRLQRLRSRTLMGIDLAWRAGDVANISGSIDLIRMLLRQRLTAEEWALIADRAAAYEAELEPNMMATRESVARNAFAMTVYRDGGRPDRATDDDHETQHERYRAIGALNVSTLKAMCATLPATTASRITDAFNRLAYPKAFDDPACMDEPLRQAAALKDLSPTQREGVASTRMAFDDAYAAVIAAMVDLCAAAPQYMPMAGRTIDEATARADERFDEEFDRLADDREEANRRALRGLRVTLLPPQMRQLTLPRP